MDCPSARTRERAYVLRENAKNIGIPVGRPRYAADHDYISYWLTDMIDYVIIFCMPEGYLAEVYTEVDGVLSTSYLGVKNIRHLLQHLKKDAFEGADELFEGIKQELDADEDGLREFLEGLEDDDRD